MACGLRGALGARAASLAGEEVRRSRGRAPLRRPPMEEPTAAGATPTRSPAMRRDVLV
jgi:hypothetical protein